ncbi:MAG: membrane protein insertion efficiency factor YidD [Candidatus Kerfeldbacteria bacterium]|nr:membrane protein insertion efficiency factor YidD [Candidatus Kerfeldbacteria bacterium]
MTRFLIVCIRVYQVTLSPDHGVFASLTVAGCRYTPTCSAYAIDALRAHGARRGAFLAIRRILRCHPWSRGGVDIVPSLKPRS